MNNLLIHSDLTTNTRRKKRGLFNSFGQALKIVTGTMDADDEEYYNEKINTIALDNRRIYQLEKDQLTIIQSTLWGVNKTTAEMKNNQDILSEGYKYLEALSQNNRQHIQNITLKFKKTYRIVRAIVSNGTISHRNTN